MPTSTTLYQDPADPRATERGRVATAEVVSAAPQTAIRRSALDTLARSLLLLAYAIAGVSLTLWALLSRGPFY